MRTTSTILFLVLSTVLVGGENGNSVGHQPLRYIGYNHDGSGVFRGCRPVTTWNEFDFKMVPSGEKDKRGKDRMKEVTDKENRQNIVWQVPHYNWCNGGMIVVGGKLLAMSDRGGLGFYADRPAEFVGAELFCIDPADGKELWRLDVDHWDLVPNGTELRKIVKEYNVKQTEVYRAWWPLGWAVRCRKLDEALYAKLSPALKKCWPEMPDDLAGYKETPAYDPKHGYEQLFFFGKVQPKLWPEIAEQRKRIMSQSGYLLDPWAGKFDHLGISMMTPVSDGEHVWVSTAYGAVFCVDLEGRVVWKKWLGAGWLRGWAIASPVLCDDLLILNGVDPEHMKNRRGRGLAAERDHKGKVRMGLDRRTGKVVWLTPPKHCGYQTGPIVLELPVGGDAKQTEAFLLYQDGDVLRARDGKKVASGLCSSATGRPWAVQGDVVVATNKIADGGHHKAENDFEQGWNALRLKAESAEKVTAELLWHTKEKLGCPVARDGLLYSFGKKSGVEARDLVTGEVVAAAKSRLTRAFHLSMIAGDHLFGLDKSGKCSVIALGKDGRTLKVIGTNRLGDRIINSKSSVPAETIFTYGCQPFFSGNRIFIRSMTDLYCLGNPKQKMVLSEEHR